MKRFNIGIRNGMFFCEEAGTVGSWVHWDDVAQLQARIAALEARLTKIYGKASSCDPSHYNNTMTEIIDLCCSAETPAEPPSWEDLRGRAPDATGHLSSEAFVRELRNEWPDPSAPKSETDCDHDLQHDTHTMLYSYPDYQTATCTVCGAQFSTDVGDSTEKTGAKHGS